MNDLLGFGTNTLDIRLFLVGDQVVKAGGGMVSSANVLAQRAATNGGWSMSAMIQAQLARVAQAAADAQAAAMRRAEEARRAAEQARIAAEAMRFAVKLATDLAIKASMERSIALAREDASNAQRAAQNLDRSMALPVPKVQPPKPPIIPPSAVPDNPVITRAKNELTAEFEQGKKPWSSFTSYKSDGFTARDLGLEPTIDFVAKQIIPLTRQAGDAVPAPLPWKVPALPPPPETLRDQFMRLPKEEQDKVFAEAKEDPILNAQLKRELGMELTQEELEAEGNMLADKGLKGTLVHSSKGPEATQIHQRANNIVLGDYLSPGELKIVNEAQRSIDTFQNNEASPLHAMTGIHLILKYKEAGKSDFEAEFFARKDSIAMANQLVKHNLDEAIKDHKSGNYVQAYKRLGWAIHTLQDSTSPVHIGFQIWNERWKEWVKEAQAHAMAEITYPDIGTPGRRNLENATRWAYEIFAGYKEMPTKFFDPTSGHILLDNYQNSIPPGTHGKPTLRIPQPPKPQPSKKITGDSP